MKRKKIDGLKHAKIIKGNLSYGQINEGRARQKILVEEIHNEQKQSKEKKP